MNNKLGFSAGVLNVILGAMLFIDAALIAFIAFFCLLMSFSLFFMAAIPAFLLTGFFVFGGTRHGNRKHRYGRRGYFNLG